MNETTIFLLILLDGNFPYNFLIQAIRLLFISNPEYYAGVFLVFLYVFFSFMEEIGYFPVLVTEIFEPLVNLAYYYALYCFHFSKIIEWHCI